MASDAEETSEDAPIEEIKDEVHELQDHENEEDEDEDFDEEE